MALKPQRRLKRITQTHTLSVPNTHTHMHLKRSRANSMRQVSSKAASILDCTTFWHYDKSAEKVQGWADMKF